MYSTEPNNQKDINSFRCNGLIHHQPAAEGKGVGGGHVAEIQQWKLATSSRETTINKNTPAILSSIGHMIHENKWDRKTRVLPFWKRIREQPWAKQALQAKEQRPWGPESRGRWEQARRNKRLTLFLLH